ncbi:MAG TPA: DUF4398 domain-containing protein [Polyangiaceae bacterium]|jgi:pyridoxal biosynthesis lyase PdxS|nr:DUF4398 domain-containing protein [Polyangiaceae bacterium]
MRIIFSLAAGALVVGCASYPMPVERLAQAEAAARSARETGANNVPQGQLHLRLAQEEIAHAQALIADDRNERAAYVLVRARADAELALAEAREAQARGDAQKALDQIAAIRGNAPVTTTGATIHITTEPSR